MSTLWHAPIARPLKRLVQLVRDEVGLHEVFVFGGLTAVIIGVRALSEPAAWIIAGLVIMGLGLFGTLAKRRT